MVLTVFVEKNGSAILECHLPLSCEAAMICETMTLQVDQVCAISIVQIVLTCSNEKTTTVEFFCEILSCVPIFKRSYL